MRNNKRTLMHAVEQLRTYHNDSDSGGEGGGFDAAHGFCYCYLLRYKKRADRASTDFNMSLNLKRRTT